MTDRDQRVPEEQRAAEESAFTQLFKLVVDSAKKEGTPANVPMKWTFETKRGDTKTPYDVLVNPSFPDRSGHPQLINIILSSNGTILQNCPVMAFWENEDPRILIYESAILEPAQRAFPVLSLVAMAKDTVKAAYAATSVETSSYPGISDRVN